MTGYRSTSIRAAGLVFLLAACGGGVATTTVEETTSTTPPTTTTVTTTTTTTTTTSVATTTITTPGDECPAAEEPPEGWRFLQTSDWVFYHPGDWEDISAQAPAQTAGTHFDAVTLAEAGVDQSEVLISYVVSSPDRQQAVLLTHLDGPTSSLEDIYQRAEERYSQSPDFEEMIAAGVADCLGGEPALQIGFLTAGTYQQSWFSLPGGTLFHADFFGATADDASIIADLFATWEWLEPLAVEPTADAFVQADMAAEVDTSAASPDPAWFTDEFFTSTGAIYAVYQLAAGTTGTIEAIWTSESGEVLLTHSYFYEGDFDWAYMGMTAPSQGFSAGNYQVALILDEGTAEITLDFTVAEG
jgi:hypothetical protein